MRFFAKSKTLNEFSKTRDLPRSFFKPENPRAKKYGAVLKEEFIHKKYTVAHLKV